MVTHVAILTDDPLDEMVERYLQTKERLKEIDDKHKADTAQGRVWLQEQVDAILAHLKAMGVESARTPNGTAYQSTVASATLADPAAFRRFVVEHEAWDLVDIKANAPAVRAWIDEHEAPPPGVNFGETVVARVRRSQ